MMATDTYFLYLLLASNAVLLAIACFAVYRFERRCRRIENFWNSPTGNVVSELGDEDGRKQIDATQRLEQQVSQLQRTVKVIEMKTPKQHAPVERTLPIENAIRMARSGASVEELKRSCGLNNGEAQLMQKLHGRSPLAAAAP